MIDILEDMVKSERKSSGCEGLDEVLHGGFLPASSHLIVGGPGAGKTVLSLQCLAAASRRGASCVYISFAEPSERLRANAAVFAWNIDDIIFVDLTRLGEGDGDADADAEDGEYGVFSPSEVERTPVWASIYEALEEHHPDWVVIDSATFLAYLSSDDYQYHKQVQRLVNHLSGLGCTSLLLFEQTALAQDVSIALAVDGVLTLANGVSQGRVVEIRSVEVNKLRGSGFMSGQHALRITNRGMTVFPHRIERLKTQAFQRSTFGSGVAALDELLMGGLSSGTVTMITGPSGAGKSTLGTQYLVEAARKGLSSVIYTFEEGAASYLARSGAVGLPLEDLLESGRIVIREINPLETYPDEFLQIVRRDVEELGAELFLLDSLRGYNLAMAEFGNLVANMHNLLTYARSKRRTVLLINELENLTGDLRISDYGVSYLCDNVLLLRFAERDGELLKVVSCLKKRLGDFRPELHEFRITAQGIQVGDKLRGLRGLLTGVPLSDSAAQGPGGHTAAGGGAR